MPVAILETDSVKYNVFVSSSLVTIFPMGIRVKRDIFDEILVRAELELVSESIRDRMLSYDMKAAHFGLELPVGVWNHLLVGKL